MYFLNIVLFDQYFEDSIRKNDYGIFWGFNHVWGYNLMINEIMNR